jgi:eukaryotic-like serine/threonine-protein kinase
MTLTPGSRLGQYEIVSSLGAGGMGEVYRARDHALGRDVAVKVLRMAFAEDPERRARLEREARVLASLNHPHIATIHGLAESTSGPALVLELVDGPTLQDRLVSGPLPLADALGFARQIADALEAAHHQGIVHRDLKPGNVKIRSDGTIKVLDFGIAKILNPSDSARAPDMPTLTETGPGVLIGTAAYMSPEQARGLEVTRQSDVWAFGAMLFEMLTGKRAFAGTTTSDVLAEILRGTLDLKALPAGTPPAIVRLVRRCLEREPKARLHDIGDARLEIEDAERALDAEPSVGASAAARPADGRWSRRALVIAAATVAVAMVAFAAYLWQSRAEDPVRQEVRLQMSPPAGMRFVSVPAISPDGRQIAFVAVPEAGGDARLFARPLAAPSATELAGTAGAAYPFWSPNSRFVAFFADGQLKRVAVEGGNPIVVSPASAGRGGLWLDDDTIVFAATPFSALVRVNAAGGLPTPFTTLAADETGHRFPQWVSARQLLYFSVNRTPEKSGTRLIEINDPDRAIEIMAGNGVGEYVNGVFVFIRGRAGVYSVLTQPMTLPGGQLTGEPVEIGRTRVSETMGRAVMATSPAGVLALIPPSDGIGQFTWISRDGRVLESVGAPAAQLGVELSPDGQQVATFRDGEIWTANLARPVPARVTRTGINRHPIWSPDGLRIASLFQGRGIGTFDLVTTAIASGDVETLRQGPNTVKPSGWAQDGRLVWIEGDPGGKSVSIWTKSPSGEVAPVLRDGARNLEARVSPDGRWIAYATDRSGRFEIEVRPFLRPGPAYPVSTEGGGYPRWRSDGRELYFLSPGGHLMMASFSADTSPRIGTPSALFETRLVAHPDRGNFAAYEYDVAADGSRFLVNRLISPPDNSMTVIVDWNPPR